MIKYICDEPLQYIANLPLCEGDDFVQPQHHADKFERISNHEQVTHDKETSLTEDWRDEIILHYWYKTHRDEFSQLLNKFEDMWDGRLVHINTARH